MSNIVKFSKSGGLTRFDRRRLDLFTKTVGKELRGSEIDEAIEWCELFGANPFVKDIYFFVFDADKPDKRRVVPVLGIGLYRKIAARTGNYRADEAPPRFTYDEKLKGPINPKGILDCEVSVFQHSHGEWHKVMSRLKWEERAPIKEIWAEDPKTGKRRPTGKFELDPKKDNWHRMGETMLSKCVEADAIRKAFPNETSGSYVAEEMDAPHTIDLTATEIVEQHRTEQRLNQVGAANSLMVQWEINGTIEHVPVGKFGDRCLEWIRKNAANAAAIKLWSERNRFALREYWARDSAGALEVKKVLEPILEAAPAEPKR